MVRTVILNETDTLVIDESQLKRESAESPPREGLTALADREVEMIQAAPRAMAEFPDLPEQPLNLVYRARHWNRRSGV